ncbi:hypothetical protein HYH03_007414 [Edaphochlamys debaryana]|uniref:Uncharacterized protein n=1 Tax=Edaphochlamys debaryana TaxID=47281 RepID=A0A835Y0F7_9CHLO|nr:hypothetical protein HYH03_007414 [Edaphochlamys debaryana]|eukprot:KAG2494357.1 hypothetical protein HYH03_007414 [Edaphochlamys debaryana]
MLLDTTPEAAAMGRSAQGDTFVWRVAAIFIILFAGLLGGLPPLFIKAFRRPEGLASQLARSLSAGVIMALALVHIIPDAVEELGQLPGTDFPVGGVCVLGGALLMVLLEHLAHVLHAPWEGVPTPSPSAPTSPGGSVAGAAGRRGGAEGDVEAGAGAGACGAKLGCSCGKGCGGSWAWAWWPSAAVPLGSTLAAPGLAAAERRQGGAHVGAEEDELSRPLLLDAPEADGHVEALEGGAEHAAPVQAVLAAAGGQAAAHAPHAPQGQRGAAGVDAVVVLHAHPHEGCPSDPAADHHHEHHQHQHDQHGEQGGHEGHSHSSDHGHTPQPATQHCHEHAHEHTADGALGHEHTGHPEGQSHAPHAPHAPCAPARSASAPAAGAGAARAAARAPAPAPSGGHRHVCVSHGNAPSLVLAAPDAAGSGPGGGGLRLRLVAIMLELGCVAHSLVIGLSIGVITGDPAAARALTIAIAAHQWLEGLGLGAVILQGGSSPARGAAMVVVYSLTAPLGIAVGMAAAASYDPASPLAVAVQGGLNGVAGGMLLYVALVQLIAEDLGRLPSPGEGGRGRGAWVRAANFGALLLGAAAMCVLALWA